MTELLVQECFSENKSVEDLTESKYRTCHYNKTHRMFLRSLRLKLVEEKVIKTNYEEHQTESLQNRRNVNQRRGLGVIIDRCPYPGNQIQN